MYVRYFYQKTLRKNYQTADLTQFDNNNYTLRNKLLQTK